MLISLLMTANHFCHSPHYNGRFRAALLRVPVGPTLTLRSSARHDGRRQAARAEVECKDYVQLCWLNALSHDRARSHRQFLCPRCSNFSSNPRCRR